LDGGCKEQEIATQQTFILCAELQNNSTLLVAFIISHIMLSAKDKLQPKKKEKLNSRMTVQCENA